MNTATLKRKVNALLDQVFHHQVVRSATLEEFGALKSEVSRLRKRSEELSRMKEERARWRPFSPGAGMMAEWRTFKQNTAYVEARAKALEMARGLDEASCKTACTLIDQVYALNLEETLDEHFLYRRDMFEVADPLPEASVPDQKALDDLCVDSDATMRTVVHATLAWENGLVYVSKADDRIRDRDVIDGGGYVGDSAYAFARHRPRSIHSFEPVSTTFERLTASIRRIPQLEATVPVKLGIGRSISRARISNLASASGNSLRTDCEKYGEDSEVVDVVNIDSYVKRHELDVALIKLDLEGEESNALEGAVDTIRHQRPVLLISIYHNPSDFFAIRGWLERLGIGYQTIVRKVSNTPIFEVMLIAY